MVTVTTHRNTRMEGRECCEMGGRRDQNFVKPVGNDESPPEVAGRIGGATICLGFENPNDRLDHAPSPSQLDA